MNSRQMLFVVTVGICAQAGAADEPTTQYVDSLQCGDTTIEISSEYSDVVCRQLRTQKITLKGGTDRMVLDSTGNQIRVPAGHSFPVQDGFLSNYLCVADVYNPKIILNFSNGGGCDDCAWSEIYSVNNRQLSGGRSPVEREAFQQAYAAVTFDGDRTEQAFIGVSQPACK